MKCYEFVSVGHTASQLVRTTTTKKYLKVTGIYLPRSYIPYSVILYHCLVTTILLVWKVLDTSFPRSSQKVKPFQTLPLSRLRYPKSSKKCSTKFQRKRIYKSNYNRMFGNLGRLNFINMKPLGYIPKSHGKFW